MLGAVLAWGAHAVHAGAGDDFTLCKQNLKNVGTALEMYSTDHLGRYPTRLALLAPDYLKVIPTCPAAGEDTYSSAFQSTHDPKAIVMFCSKFHDKPEEDKACLARQAEIETKAKAWAAAHGGTPPTEEELGSTLCPFETDPDYPELLYHVGHDSYSVGCSGTHHQAAGVTAAPRGR